MLREVVDQVLGPSAPASAYDLGYFSIPESGSPWPTTQVVRLVDGRNGAVVDVWLRRNQWGYMPSTWLPPVVRRSVGTRRARRINN